MLSLLLVLAAYLLGAIPFGYVVARAVRGIDIREHGSKNIGATNVGRVLGWQWFGVVFALDFTKAAVPVGLAILETLPGPVGLSSSDWAAALGLVVLVGNMWPVYLGFRGGKGVATGAGLVTCLVPLPALFAVLTFLCVLGCTRFVSLSSILAAVALVLARFAERSDSVFANGEVGATLVCCLGALLVIFRHRANIQRLIAGTEPRLGERPRLPPSESAD